MADLWIIGVHPDLCPLCPNVFCWELSEFATQKWVRRKKQKKNTQEYNTPQAHLEETPKKGSQNLRFCPLKLNNLPIRDCAPERIGSWRLVGHGTWIQHQLVVTQSSEFCVYKLHPVLNLSFTDQGTAFFPRWKVPKWTGKIIIAERWPSLLLNPVNKKRYLLKSCKAQDARSKKIVCLMFFCFASLFFLGYDSFCKHSS